VLQLQVLLPSLLPPATSGPQPLVQGWTEAVQLVILSCSPAGQLAVPPPLSLEPFVTPELEPELLEITLLELLPPPPVEPPLVEPPLVEPRFEEFAAPLPDPEKVAEPEEVPPKGPLPGSGAGPLSELPLPDELG
jgi:hypothetical protein